MNRTVLVLGLTFVSCGGEARNANVVVALPAMSVAPCVDTRSTCENCAGAAVMTLDSFDAGAPLASTFDAGVSGPHPGLYPFDRGMAAGALSAVARTLDTCAEKNGPTGTGHVLLTFAPSGKVTRVVIDQPPFAGTHVAKCIEAKFGAVSIPSFGGTDMTVGKTFVVP